MEITIETDSYNQRRCGKPWIAKVDFSNPKGNFEWGGWTGDAYNGGEGVLSINANPGDIIERDALVARIAEIDIRLAD